MKIVRITVKVLKWTFIVLFSAWTLLRVMVFFFLILMVTDTNAHTFAIQNSTAEPVRVIIKFDENRGCDSKERIFLRPKSFKRVLFTSCPQDGQYQFYVSQLAWSPSMNLPSASAEIFIAHESGSYPGNAILTMGRDVKTFLVIRYTDDSLSSGERGGLSRGKRNKEISAVIIPFGGNISVLWEWFKKLFNYFGIPFLITLLLHYRRTFSPPTKPLLDFLWHFILWHFFIGLTTLEPTLLPHWLYFWSPSALSILFITSFTFFMLLHKMQLDFPTSITMNIKAFMLYVSSLALYLLTPTYETGLKYWFATNIFLMERFRPFWGIDFPSFFPLLSFLLFLFFSRRYT